MELRRRHCAVIDTEDRNAAVRYFPSNISGDSLLRRRSDCRCHRLLERELRVPNAACCDWKLLFVTFLSCAAAELVFITTCAAHCVCAKHFIGLTFLQAWIQSLL